MYFWHKRMTMLFLENISLRKYHTFATEAKARYFLEFSDAAELLSFRKERPELFDRFLVLGGGSNLLFVGDFPGLVIHPAVPGIELVGEDDRQVWLRAGAGVVWDDFVQYAVERGWGGVENLSLIPGRVGAVPVQNIGAYGQEAGNVISSVAGIDLLSGGVRELEAPECAFAYRNSVFKGALKDTFIITSVVFRLDKVPTLVLGYGDILKEVEVKDMNKVKVEVKDKIGGETLPGVKEVREAVIDIRRRKLPDPAVLGNGGSFFKNPTVEKRLADELRMSFPGMPVYPAGEDRLKLSAGWMIDQCGWKGFRRGDAGVHRDHALVLVNYGNASGKRNF